MKLNQISKICNIWLLLDIIEYIECGTGLVVYRIFHSVSSLLTTRVYIYRLKLIFLISRWVHASLSNGSFSLLYFAIIFVEIINTFFWEIT